MMVGVNISDEQLGTIADRTLSEADEDQDGFISFAEFSKVNLDCVHTMPAHFENGEKFDG